MGELYHHGILGQKWGVRRFQNADGSLTKSGAKRYGTEGSEKTGKQYSKRLNDLDQARAFWVRDSYEATQRSNRLQNKITKKELKGKDTTKLKDKLEVEKKTIHQSEEMLKKGKAETDKLLKEIKDSGKFKVGEFYIQRDVTRGKDFVKDLLLSAAMSTGNSTTTVHTSYSTSGKIYKVKEKKDGE